MPAPTQPRRRAALPLPKKSLGQHFLTDPNILARIVDATGAGPGTTVLEVGAGPGDLTEALAQRAKLVVAVELDDELAERLAARFLGRNVAVVHADVLDLTPGELLRAGGAAPPYVMAGNLPYNIASAVVRHFLEGDARPERMVVMVQREAADAMTARPGAMSLLSVAVQVYGEARRLFLVAPGAFRPPPRVQSAVVRIDVASRPRGGAPAERMDAFFRVARAGFSSPRKQLRNSLAIGLGLAPGEAERLLQEARIDQSRRPQTLAIEEWSALTRAYLTRFP